MANFVLKNTNKGFLTMTNKNSHKGLLPMKNSTQQALFDMFFSKKVNNQKAPLQKKIKTLIYDLGYTNIHLDDGGLYFDRTDFNLFINFQQDIVEPGLPKQIIIRCDVDSNYIKVASLASTYNEETDIEMDWVDIADLSFSWEALEDILVKYHNATYESWLLPS